MFEELTPQNKESVEKILTSLLQEENLEMKTEIQNPRNMAKLFMLGQWLKMEGVPEGETLINAFIAAYLKYMVSNQRKSREEIVRAISESLKREKPLTEKLTGQP